MTDEILSNNRYGDKAFFLECLKELCLFDDAFMTVVFKEPELAELLLRIILDKPDLTVIECKPQNDVKNLYGRSTRLDVFAKDSAGKLYDIEVQRENAGAVPERARFNSSLLDANNFKTNEEFKNLPETFVIFITENDYFKRNLPIYTIERFVSELNEQFNDGSHIIYVNGQNRDNTDLGRLMADFSCKEPNGFNFKMLGEAVRYYKYDTKGADSMCRIMEDIRERGIELGRAEGRAEGRVEGRAEGRVEGRVEGHEEGRAERNRELALKAVSKGKQSLEEIAEFYELTLDEVKDLAKRCQNLYR